MAPIEIRSRVGPDGVLKFSLPIGATDANREVKVIIEPTDEGSEKPPASRRDWERFVAETAGSIADPTFVRPEQGEYEARGELFP